VSIRRIALAVAPLGVVFGLVGCGGPSASKSTTTPATSPAVTKPTPPTTRPATTATTTQTPPGALQAEANSAATGDIPDNQVFLVFRNPLGGWSMKYPEGWAQNGSGRQVAFRDKNNIVRVVVIPGSAPTATSVRRDLVRLGSVHVQGAPQQLTLPSGPALKVAYTTESAPNAVTGKRVTLAVDRYYVGPRGGKLAIVDLGTPQGVDNVDAYRLMIQSFRWR
jgi:hypothetical protein